MAHPIDLQFPSGVSRRLGNRASAMGRREYSTPWAMNVRLEDGLSNRLRGGSFLGIDAGTRPSSIVYRGRTLTFSGRAVTASRVGDSADTSMASDVSDMLRATPFQFSEAEEQGSSIVALVPNDDQYLLAFTSGQTWVQQGDPLSGPRQQVSDQVGIIGADAWCVAHDTVYFLSSQGLYSVGVNGGGLKAISEDVVPEDLLSVSDTACTLTYQHSDRGVYIHKSGTDWFYDTAREQFWPFGTITRETTEDGDFVIAEDGDFVITEDSEGSTSHVLLGPIKLGQADRLGLVQSLHGIVAESSDTVTWRIIPGDSAEEAAANGKLAITAALAGTSYASYVKADGSWSAGRSQTARPRVAAMWVCLWLQATGDWAYEGSQLQVVDGGWWRK